MDARTFLTRNTMFWGLWIVPCVCRLQTAISSHLVAPPLLLEAAAAPVAAAAAPVAAPVAAAPAPALAAALAAAAAPAAAPLLGLDNGKTLSAPYPLNLGGDNFTPKI